MSSFFFINRYLLNSGRNIRLTVPFGIGFAVEDKSSVDDEKIQLSDDLFRRFCGCCPITRKIERTGFINTLLRMSRIP